MTVVNPKSISGINSITTGSGSDNLLTIHTSDASSTERVRINSSGDVIVGSGITVSPDGDIFATGVTTSTTFVGALTGNVTGNISGGTVAGSTGTFTGDVDIADKIVHTGDTNTAIRFPDADTITAETGGSERLRITSDGKIGINKSSPSNFLHVAGSGYQTARFENTDNGADGAYVELYNNSSSPADNDYNGIISFKNRNSAAEEITYSQIRAQSTDVTDGTEDGNLTFHTRANGTFGERARIDSGGRILKGLTTARANYANNTSGVEFGVQIEATNGNDSTLSLVRSSNDANDGGIFIGKTRATSVGGNTVVQAGDDLGTITFGGADGTSLQFGAQIIAEVQSGVGNDDMPTDLILKTNGGSTSTTERLRITSVGGLQHNGGTSNHYVLTNSGKAINHIHIDGQTGNSGEMGGAISFDCGGTGCAAIAGLQQSSDPDKIGLAFIVHKTSTASDDAIEAMRIDNDGHFRFGATGAIQNEKYTFFRPEADQNTLAYFHSGASSDVTGVIFRHGRALSGFNGKQIGFLRNDGTEVGSIISGNSSTSFNTSSDYRIKENQVSISDGITRLKTLKPYRFNFKEEPSVTVDGFFAHEVTAVPEAIAGTKDAVDSDNNPVYQGIDQSKLVPLLTAALQEAVAKIETLETKVAALEGS